MLRKCKYFLLSFVFFISSLLPCISVYAQGTSWTAEEKVRYVGNAFYKIFTDISGVLVPSGLNGSDLQRDFQAYVLNSDVIQDNMSYDEWIASEIGITYQNGDSVNADITYSSTFQNTINNFAHDWVDENLGYIYGYSYSVSSLMYLYANQDDFNAVSNFITENDDKIIVLSVERLGYTPVVFYVIDYESNMSFLKSVIDNSANRIQAISYHGWNADNYTSYDYYRLDTSTHEVKLMDIHLSGQSNMFFSMDEVTNYTFSSYSLNIVNKNSKQYQIYKSLDALKDGSQGVQPCYITDSFNSNWQDNSITDSYNTTTTAVNNTISYEDVANYVNNYYVENNSYPTTNTVYNYINNYVPPDNGGNGGDNGGNGSSNIWDFLGSIGDFLGSLIEGLGNVLSGILSLLTDVIDMFIGENGLPNTISQLIAYFIPFLPEEYVQLILLSITLMVIVGIIKLIRG